MCGAGIIVEGKGGTIEKRYFVRMKQNIVIGVVEGKSVLVGVEGSKTSSSFDNSAHVKHILTLAYTLGVSQESGDMIVYVTHCVHDLLDELNLCAAGGVSSAFGVCCYTWDGDVVTKGFKNLIQHPVGEPRPNQGEPRPNQGGMVFCIALYSCVGCIAFSVVEIVA